MKFIVYTINRYNFCVYIHDLDDDDDDDENKTRIRDTYVFMHIYCGWEKKFKYTHYRLKHLPWSIRVSMFFFLLFRLAWFFCVLLEDLSLRHALRNEGKGQGPIHLFISLSHIAKFVWEKFPLLKSVLSLVFCLIFELELPSRSFATYKSLGIIGHKILDFCSPRVTRY